MTRDFIVGVIFLASLALIGTLTFYLKQFPTGSGLLLEIGFEDVGGLEAGDPVRVRGLKAGVVDMIELQEDRGRALVRIKLNSDLSPRGDHTFLVKPASALGGSYLHYDPGKGDLAPIDNLRGRSEGDILGMVGKILGENRERIESGLESLDSLLKSLNAGDGIFGGLLKDPEAKTKFLQIVDDMYEITGDLREGKGILGSLRTEDSEQHKQFKSILADIRAAMQEFRDGKGAIGLLFKDQEVRQKVQSAVDRIDVITAKLTGTDALAGTILNDATFKDTWTNTVANLNAASEQLTKDGTGSLSRILHDQELATKMDSAVSSIASISSSIENGPGTLNSLIKDPGLYEEARETLTLLRDSTEDLREQEPVTAFFSILFAPF